MSVIYESEAPNPNELFIRDPKPEICDWQGSKALQLSGQGACLLVVPDLFLSEGWIEVDIGSDGAAYPGIVFRVLDSLNYELAYIQPHTSGQWDAFTVRTRGSCIMETEPRRMWMCRYKLGTIYGLSSRIRAL